MIGYEDQCPACTNVVDFRLSDPSIFREELDYLKEIAGDKAGDMNENPPELFANFHMECPDCHKGFFAHFNIFLHSFLMEVQRNFPDVFVSNGELSDELFFIRLTGDLRRWAVNQSVTLLSDSE